MLMVLELVMVEAILIELLSSLIGSNQRKPLIIGLGYDYQILSKNLAEPHDLRYHKVVTESRILSYN